MGAGRAYPVQAPLARESRHDDVGAARTLSSHPLIPPCPYPSPSRLPIPTCPARRVNSTGLLPLPPPQQASSDVCPRPGLTAPRRPSLVSSAFADLAAATRQEAPSLPSTGLADLSEPRLPDVSPSRLSRARQHRASTSAWRVPRPVAALPDARPSCPHRPRRLSFSSGRARASRSQQLGSDQLRLTSAKRFRCRSHPPTTPNVCRSDHRPAGS